MTRTLFNRFCKSLTDIANMKRPKREQLLNIFMSQGYLWLDLTEKQVDQVKNLLIVNYPDKCKIHEPDENGFTMDFGYLRFK